MQYSAPNRVGDVGLSKSEAKWEGYVGGPGRDRTDDLFHAMEARSQLRHRPTGIFQFSLRFAVASNSTRRVLVN